MNESKEKAKQHYCCCRLYLPVLAQRISNSFYVSRVLTFYSSQGTFSGRRPSKKRNYFVNFRKYSKLFRLKIKGKQIENGAQVFFYLHCPENCFIGQYIFYDAKLLPLPTVDRH